LSGFSMTIIAEENWGYSDSAPLNSITDSGPCTG